MQRKNNGRPARPGGPWRTITAMAAALLLFSGAPASASTAPPETVVVPLKLDYPLLKQLMIQQLFDPRTRRVEILGDPAKCSRIYLSDPDLGHREQRLKIRAHVDAQIATALLGTCTPLFSWTGDAEFLAVPVILPGARAVRLEVTSTRLFDTQRRQLNSGPLWELADGRLQPLLGRYQVDLAPSLDELGKLLPQLLRSRSAQQITRITDSLALADIRVTGDGLGVDVSLQVDRLPVATAPEAALTPGELARLEAKWQMMDAMITNAVKQYADLTTRPELREGLLEILLDARYGLRDAVTRPVSHAEDPVRHWFIASWQRLGPLLRSIGTERPGREPLVLVSLLTATDALRALDRLGPAIGLDISADGLKRMGRLLIDQPGIDPLAYDLEVDPELRRLFGLPAAPGTTGPTGLRFDLWPVRSAWAGSSSDRLNRWVPKKDELPRYLPELRDLLLANANRVEKDKQLESRLGQLYRRTVLTTAWQESCWRQYVLERQKIVPLRSNTGDSGLMQLNERVWRGLYDPQKLRWDIDYNARAGAEVLAYYLTRYALKRGEQKQGGWDNLARATYSAYNGGPGQTARYRNPKASAGHRKIDAAFWKKYQAVKQGKAFRVAECLGGDAQRVATEFRQPTAARPPVPSPRQKVPVAARSAGGDWVDAQPKHHYTLQMAVFSSPEAAQRFKTQNRLRGSVAIVPLGGDRLGQYVVLNGSFATRADADQWKRHYPKLKPWVQRFDQILPKLKR